MINEILTKFLQTTKFTTSKTERNFVPRRVGLGYDLVTEFNDPEIVKECKKKSRKIKEKCKEVKDEEDEPSKLSLMKRRR
ncbi:hypothetical protein NBO_2g0040 [Nosema bombycis CQ1]|uniref:Uncharacterized protein n=1 Tax=Nosema bombycis (strain CQ1 / CVCC 102059) TaxID=578461 RepID=R0MRM0_NOSB1|nr:hypothetical protein NBO_2g0040 [Nosema bombycis CQ1]|eukprot:EOB15548.1 hypothetical protein NBO_2g0040 [Nosema bombycis CQ1]